MVGLSLGCGTGHRERKWMALCDFKALYGFNISPESIATANASIQNDQHKNILKYEVFDIYKMEFKQNYYDVIFAEQSLHHFAPMKKILHKISGALKRRGYLILNEFVGPRRFQWTSRQLNIANSVYNILPCQYTKHIVDGSSNKQLIRPSRL